MMNYNNLAKMMLWLSLGLSSVFFMNQVNGSPYYISIFFLAVLIIIHGIFSFYKHGGDFITPTGIYMLVSVVIGGIPAILMIHDSSYDIVFGHWIATYSVFTGQVLIYHVFGSEQKSIRKCTKEGRTQFLPKKLITWAYVLGLFLAVMGLIFSLINYGFESFLTPSVYVSMVIILVALWRSGGGGISVHKLVITIALFFVYYQFFFSGFGRINVATLLLVLVLSMNHKFLNKNLKKIIVIGTFPAMLMASYVSAGGNSGETRGMGSMISPHYRFGELIQMYNEGVLDLFWGKTIWAAIVTPVPREFWADKPWNFNREITFIFRPEYIEDGHSEASVIYAEWFFNFGYPGIVLAILSMGLFLKVIDSMYLKAAVNFNWKRIDFVKHVTLLILMVGLIDLYWGGFSTFMARGGIRLLVFYAVLMIFLIYIQRKRKKMNRANYNDMNLKFGNPGNLLDKPAMKRKIL
ncbi:hypothetical protein [Salisediminibacterium halotolerans]|uniref:hypothetical protein n=1 Tax=Salisediminibacterium halotolerans TaxID=517425 RepID=UPI000EB36E96|nr:hypothetical protein [Salisediminibacterium halotolerans]RLJ75698.1 hypothetical protein BCL39_1216 [Actinophytocola xinjiangensis]RPE89552.1 hypothetical protein EDD67_0329 [Salisediminibacterium halotolerans]TWG36311.1 hypothetical protein BCL52_1213 [Salisediminibacterium halotolerans]GEL07241.1 hypothetical protein SHA02_06570 [Salisediminibacterium halotolerans]